MAIIKAVSNAFAVLCIGHWISNSSNISCWYLKIVIRRLLGFYHISLIMAEISAAEMRKIINVCAGEKISMLRDNDNCFVRLITQLNMQ